ncbi:MAG: tryptophan 7-halogenase [Paracoccaceae bacterium]
MKIAILGGGTAGFIAAAHLTKTEPKAELLHIYDSRIPTIGVGEGTTPRFPQWLKHTTGLDFADLQEHCGATLKTGTRFEGWGTDGQTFYNRFQPTRLIGFHFDASKVVGLIAEHVHAQYIDARVVSLDTTDAGALVALESGATLHCDYVLDARGFPKSAQTDGSSDDDVIQMDWIPTGRAILRRLPASDLSGVTRAVARPHGWIFQIPLNGTTSCGYLFNSDLNSDDEVEADFSAFLNNEKISEWEERGALSYPNFLRRDLFDGRVFSIGNAASFIEPLEATSIGASILQVRAAQRWIADSEPNTANDTAATAGWNRAMRSYVLRNSLFVAWHYACGSRWDTPFWDLARSSMERARNSEDARPHLQQMNAFVDAGRALPGLSLAGYDDQESWDREVLPLLTLYEPFGNFSELNFAQIGHGMGYYNTTQSGAPAYVNAPQG